MHKSFIQSLRGRLDHSNPHFIFAAWPCEAQGPPGCRSKSSCREARHCGLSTSIPCRLAQAYLVLSNCLILKRGLCIRKISSDIYVGEQMKKSLKGFSPTYFWLKPTIFLFISPNLKVGAIAAAPSLLERGSGGEVDN